MLNVLLNDAPYNRRSVTSQFKFLDDEVARETHDKSAHIYRDFLSCFQRRNVQRSHLPILLLLSGIQVTTESQLIQMHCKLYVPIFYFVISFFQIYLFVQYQFCRSIISSEQMDK